jgi:radical SAM protein with 4Fe4S-binding SPASM domain
MATLRCGLGCPHCLAAGEVEAPADMPLDEAIDLIDQAAEMGVHELLVTGGEPLIRQDLPEMINHLGRRNQTWSLNTSAMPSSEMRRAIEAHRPAFVAVSLDGPQPVHDAFRGRTGNYEEVLESLRYFSSLDGVNTAAGTTITSVNFSRLDQTRRIVQHLGVGHWGIHLLAPEGRAAVREDLELTPKQKRKLLADVARWRRTMPVNLADEIGYCGPGEAMLRGEPFACGAGRTQCVVLPDGHVVPCNTLDIGTAGGNLHIRSLAEIWRSGFDELRNYSPAEKCRTCEHASSCGGGCWLHRRAGTQCSKDVWQGAAWAKAAAGVAICLAGLAGADAVRAEEPVVRDRGEQKQVEVAADSLARAEEHILAEWIVRYTQPMGDTASSGRGAKANAVPENLTDQPVWKMIDLWQRGKLPEKMDDRCELIEAILKSDCENLSVLGLALQTIVDPILEGAWPVDQRTYEQRQRLGRIWGALNSKAMLAQQQYITAAIKQYKAGRGLPYRPMSKAVRPGERLHNSVIVQRLGLAGVKKDRILAGLAKSKFDPLWAREMQIRVESVDKNTLLVIRPGHQHGKATDAAVGPFDAIESRGQDAPVKVCISWPGEPKRTVLLSLPTGKRVYWADLLYVVGREAGKELHKELTEKLSNSSTTIEPNPLYLPVIRKLPDSLQADEDPPRHDSHASRQIRVTVMHWLANFWML